MNKEKITFIKASEVPDRKLVIKADENALIDDIGGLTDIQWLALGELMKPKLLVLDAMDLSRELAPKIPRDSDYYLYPLIGGMIAQMNLRLAGGKKLDDRDYEVITRRCRPTDKPSAELPSKLFTLLKDGNAKVTIVDDVIASGGTISAVAEAVQGAVIDQNRDPNKVEERFSQFDKVTYALPVYNAATWLKYQTNRKPECYYKPIPVVASLEYSGVAKRPALNSLSTLTGLTGVSAKTIAVRQAYADRYSKNPREFVGLLNEISQELGQ